MRSWASCPKLHCWSGALGFHLDVPGVSSQLHKRETFAFGVTFSFVSMPPSLIIMLLHVSGVDKEGEHMQTHPCKFSDPLHQCSLTGACRARSRILFCDISSFTLAVHDKTIEDLKKAAHCASTRIQPPSCSTLCEQCSRRWESTSNGCV